MKEVVSERSDIFGVALDIQLDKFKVALSDQADLFFKSLDFEHEVCEDLGPLFVFAQVFVLFQCVLIKQIFVLSLPVLGLIIFQGGGCASLVLKFGDFIVDFFEVGE